MKCFVGIDLGSTTTKAVLLDEERRTLGEGITNSRSNYATATKVAKLEALISARLNLFRRALGAGQESEAFLDEMVRNFRHEQFLEQLEDLHRTCAGHVTTDRFPETAPAVRETLDVVFERLRADSTEIFAPGGMPPRPMLWAAMVRAAQRLGQLVGDEGVYIVVGRPLLQSLEAVRVLRVGVGDRGELWRLSAARRLPKLPACPEPSWVFLVGQIRAPVSSDADHRAVVRDVGLESEVPPTFGGVRERLHQVLEARTFEVVVTQEPHNWLLTLTAVADRTGLRFRTWGVTLGRAPCLSSSSSRSSRSSASVNSLENV